MTCNEAPVARRCWQDVSAAYKGVYFSGIIGDQAHQTRRSSHNCAPMQESGAYNPYYAHALDIGHGGNRALARLIREALLRDPRVRYVIDNGIGYYPSGGWFYSYDHESHVHVSFLPGTTFDTHPFTFTTTGDDDEMLSDEAKKWIQNELSNQDDRIVARVRADVYGRPGKPSRLVKKLNRILTHLGLRED